MGVDAVFVHVPRTAGIYIQEALGLKILRYPHRARRLFKQEGRVTFGHMDYRKLVRKGVVGKEFNRRAFKFAFVRNPFDRAVSHYHYARRRHPDILDPGVGFLDWTRTLEDYGRVFCPQYFFLEGIQLDKVGRFESLDDDLLEVAEELGVEVDDDIGPRNTTRHRPFQTYYDGESEERVREFYRGDFERFGYDDHLLH